MSYRTDDGWEDREMEPDYGDSRWRGHLYKALVSAGVLCAFGAAVLYAYSEGPPAEEANRSTTVPLVKAEASAVAVKEKPADPGGQKVPHRDSDLYKKLDIAPSAGDDAKDRQRAETPRPLPRAQNYEDILAPRDDATRRPPRADETPTAAPAADEVADRTPPETAPGDDTAARREGDIGATPSLRGAHPAAREPDTQLASRPAGDRTETKPDSPAAADAIGPYRVQLGAFRTPVKARHEWRNLIRSNRDLLGELSMVIERVDLGPKGIFYRLQAGPLRTEPAARGLCRTLDKRKVGCILVHG